MENPVIGKTYREEFGKYKGMPRIVIRKFTIYYKHINNDIVGVDGELLAGSLPVKQLKLVQAWVVIHEEELYEAWNKAVRNEPFDKIEPLK